LIENKIDAGYSVTRLGYGQPERYQKTLQILRATGETVASVLVAPRKYLTSSPSAPSFEHRVEYEQLVPLLDAEDRAIVETAIAQAALPYEAVANLPTGDFFKALRIVVQDRFPDLKLNKDPNANGVRPTASRTPYFDVGKMLTIHPGIPVPRMSLQCWDKAAAAASVKIMIGNWGRFARAIPHHPSLDDEGAYLRPAKQSLGIVIDTPRPDTQRPLADQIEQVVECLEAALRLQRWWNTHSEVLHGWQSIVHRLASR
jgi:hypothetical protein